MNRAAGIGGPGIQILGNNDDPVFSRRSPHVLATAQLVNSLLIKLPARQIGSGYGPIIVRVKDDESFRQRLAIDQDFA